VWDFLIDYSFSPSTGGVAIDLHSTTTFYQPGEDLLIHNSTVNSEMREILVAKLLLITTNKNVI
jgi:hypothetical protein